MRRFFVEDLTNRVKVVSIIGNEFHHLRDVLRLKVGDEVSIFDGRGNNLLGKIEAMTRDSARVVIMKRLGDIRESPLEIILCQALAKAEKMDLIVQKAVELGVSRVIPFFTSRTVPKLGGDKMARKVERWQRIALESVKQCGRAMVPKVEKVVGFSEALKGWEGYLRLILWEGEKVSTLKGIYKECSKVVVLVGPEGGFTTEEVKEAEGAGFTPVSLGPRILRTETSAISIVAIIQYELGDMGRLEKP